MKINIYFFVNAEFYRVVWTINVLLTVRSKMIPFSGNNQNIKMFRVSPEHFALGLCTYYIMIICHWAILHYNMSFKTIAGRSDGCFLMISCTFWRSTKKIVEFTKTTLVALTLHQIIWFDITPWWNIFRNKHTKLPGIIFFFFTSLALLKIPCKGPSEFLYLAHGFFLYSCSWIFY